MEIRVTESYTISTAQYEPYSFTITVGMNHKDLGYSDDDLLDLNEIEAGQLNKDLRDAVALEIAHEVKSHLLKGDALSTQENLSHRALDYLHTNVPANQLANKGVKNAGNPKAAPKPRTSRGVRRGS